MLLHGFLEDFAGRLWLAGLQKAQREIDAQRAFPRISARQRLENRDGAGVHPEAKIDVGEEILSLAIEGLEPEGALQLLLRLVDAVVREELAPAVQVEEEFLCRDVAGTAGSLAVCHVRGTLLREPHGRKGPRTRAVIPRHR
jgi:hypothetical protein